MGEQHRPLNSEWLSESVNNVGVEKLPGLLFPSLTHRHARTRALAREHLFLEEEKKAVFKADKERPQG